MILSIIIISAIDIVIMLYYNWTLKNSKVALITGSGADHGSEIRSAKRKSDGS